jgi:hypothetical protein
MLQVAVYCDHKHTHASSAPRRCLENSLLLHFNLRALNTSLGDYLYQSLDVCKTFATQTAHLVCRWGAEVDTAWIDATFAVPVRGSVRPSPVLDL